MISTEKFNSVQQGPARRTLHTTRAATTRAAGKGFVAFVIETQPGRRQGLKIRHFYAETRSKARSLALRSGAI